MISQPAGDAGNDQRADQADAVAHPNREVRDALAVQVARRSRRQRRLATLAVWGTLTGRPRGEQGRPNQLFRGGLRRSGSRLPCPGARVVLEPAGQHGLQASRRIDLGAWELWPGRACHLVSGDGLGVGSAPAVPGAVTAMAARAAAARTILTVFITSTFPVGECPRQGRQRQPTPLPGTV